MCTSTQSGGSEIPETEKHFTVCRLAVGKYMRAKKQIIKSYLGSEIYENLLFDIVFSFRIIINKCRTNSYI